MISYNQDLTEFDEDLPKGIQEMSYKAWARFGDDCYRPVRVNHTVHIEGDVYLLELMKELQMFSIETSYPEKIKAYYESRPEILKFYKMGRVSTQRGSISFEKRKIKDFAELKARPNQYLFNCMGYYSKNIFADENLIPLKGVMLCFKNTTRVMDFYSINLPGGGRTHIYPGQRRVGVGISKIQNDFDEEEDKSTREKLYDNAWRFFRGPAL